MTATSKTPVTLINVLTVIPERQHDLLDSLRHNTETVIKTLKGWISTSLIASMDGTRVVIHSQWESAADVEAMRTDARMQAYFPKVAALASLDSTIGQAIVSHHR